jgi:hypothetical protein
LLLCDGLLDPALDLRDNSLTRFDGEISDFSLNFICLMV